MTNVHFVGRLATYKYYNMDQVVAQALTMFQELMGLREQRVATKRPNGHSNGHTVVAPGAVGGDGVHAQPGGRAVLRST